MLGIFPGWMESKPFEQQVLISALVLDPIGFLTGYLVGPFVGLEPLYGGVAGLVAASIPLSLLVMQEAQKQQ
ncbi:hypothetical protein [Natronoarchaeum rubrum]|uniref:hypothetical protein n=1 Tax=Natronoarchaeum rubrum TaxID=755311 RepID=UPI0021122990|nr:hypothetical protein [Natronoarchaeum rubrum]